MNTNGREKPATRGVAGLLVALVTGWVIARGLRANLGRAGKQVEPGLEFRGLPPNSFGKNKATNTMHETGSNIA